MLKRHYAIFVAVGVLSMLLSRLGVGPRAGRPGLAICPGRPTVLVARRVKRPTPAERDQITPNRPVNIANQPV